VPLPDGSSNGRGGVSRKLCAVRGAKQGAPSCATASSRAQIGAPLHSRLMVSTRGSAAPSRKAGSYRGREVESRNKPSSHLRTLYLRPFPTSSYFPSLRPRRGGSWLRACKEAPKRWPATKANAARSAHRARHASHHLLRDSGSRRPRRRAGDARSRSARSPASQRFPRKPFGS
jgi:hypothetical protein